MTELRQWQREALRRFDANRQDFLAVATPGAGKTTFAIAAAKSMMDSGEISRLIVIVPTAHLRRQWSTAAAALGVQLDSRFTNGIGAIAKDYDGPVVTYAAVASEPLLWRRHSTAAKTLVILDEIHHAGEHDNLSWGPALKQAFELAARRLLLSGTPFRSDGAAIPFVRYDDTGLCIASVEYGYREALQDGNVVRPVEFPVLDGTMRWRLNKVELETELSAADDSTMASAMAVAIDPEGSWMPSVLRRADEELSRVRENMPDAGGLVLAADQAKARRYAQILNRITGEPIALAISDEPDASDVIHRFAHGSKRWIVAVQMVSEGVDIPRLAVGVYASRTRTKMFFRQVVGRLVRMRSAADETYATLFIPAIEPLVRYAREIEETAADVLREQSERTSSELNREPGEVALFDLVESTESDHIATVLSGVQPDDAELRRAMVAMRAAGITSGISVAQAALLLRAGGVAPVVGTVQVSVPVQRTEPSRVDQKRALRQTIKSRLAMYVKQSGGDYAKVHYDLNRHFNEKNIDHATVETLQGRLQILERWIAEG